jgi:zinc/manganese transport system substrate-binding protein
MKRASLLVLLAAALMIGITSSAQDRLRVVVTYSILGDLVQNVAGDAADIVVLVGTDSDTHTYEPSPQDVVRVSEADLIFENGLGFETWFDDLYEASGSSAPRVAVSDGIVPLAFEGHAHEGETHEGETHEGETHEGETHEGEAHEGEAHEGEEHEGEEHGHDHDEFDPHVWHDPNNAIIMVENIRAALAAADPANEATYNANAAAYTEQLVALDAYIAEQVALIPEENRVLFTSHDTFGYFGARYGFSIDSALQSSSTESADPSAASLAALITEIQEAGVPAIFAENVANSTLMQQIADNAGVALYSTLYTDALGAAGSPGATYLGMMRYNVDIIVSALTQ